MIGVLLVVHALSAPLQGDKTAHLLQTLAPTTGADDAQRTKTLHDLRETLLPLAETVDARLARVDYLETTETDPLMTQLATLNETIQSLQHRINDAHARLHAIPSDQHNTQADKEQAAGLMTDVENERSRITTEINTQVSTLEAHLVEVRSDLDVVSRLLLWIQQLPQTEERETVLAQVKASLAKLHSATNFLEESQVTGDSVEQLLHHLVSSLRESESGLQNAVANATDSLATAQTRLTKEHAAHQQSYDTAEALIAQLNAEHIALTESLASNSLALSEAQASETKTKADVDAIHQLWRAERAHLSELKTTIKSILLMLDSH